MMKTKKYIIINTEDRLPKDFDQYYTNQGLIDFNPKDGNFWDENDDHELYPNWWLEEVPDMEEEMRDVLLQLVGCHTCGHKIPDWLNDKAEELLIKLKQ